MAYLTGGSVSVTHQGVRLPLTLVRSDVDVDEVEAVLGGGPLRITIRQAVDVVWTSRYSFVNDSSEDLLLDDVRIGWRAPAGKPAWGLAAGSTAAYLVPSPGGPGLILGGASEAGSVAAIDADGVHLSPLRLRPGGRAVVLWRWRWHRGALAVRAGLPALVPHRTTLAHGEAAAIGRDDDRALVLPPGVTAEADGPRLVLEADAPGRYPVEIRGSRGVVHLDLTWAPPWHAAIREAADAAWAELAAEHRSGRSVLGVSQALVVQRALLDGVVADSEHANAAISATVLEAPATGESAALRVALLVGEAERRADPELADTAVRLFLTTSEAVPGVGLAGVRLCLCLLALGQPATAVLAHLVGLRDRIRLLPRPTDPGVIGTRLELELVTRARVASAATPAPSDGSSIGDSLVALAWWLGAGLPGDPVCPMPLAAVGHLAVVLALATDEFDAEMIAGMGCTASELALAAESRILAAARSGKRSPARGGHAEVDGLAWLAIARVFR